jgi:DNA-binding transcriptional ArsR family regulator
MPLLVADPSAAHDVEALLAVVARTSPVRLHRVLLGGERRHVLDVVPREVVDGAAAGDDVARRQLVAAYAGDRLVVTATDHVLHTPSAQLKQEVLETIDRWTAARPGIEPPPAAAVTETIRRVRDAGAPDHLEQAIPGLTYGLREDDHVVLVLTKALASVVVVVDGVDSTVIAHAPDAEEPPGCPETDAGHLLELARAVGDRTRMRILTVLREADRTAGRLSAELGAPRTTLLHHLAILRAAGLIRLDVAPGSPTVYRLRPEGLRELAALADAFLSQ